jgi:hypothetical protein
MYFADFKDLIRRNQASNAQVTFYRDSDINPDNIAIFDRGKLRRDPDRLEQTGYAEEDHWRDSHICELAFFNGEVPLEGYSPKIDKQADKLVGKPYRGVLAALAILINEGSLRRTDELRQFFADNGRRFPDSAT